MAEVSVMWTTGSTGDGASPYTQTQVQDWIRRTFLGNNPATQGVLKGYASDLAVTGTATPLSVAAGAAVVYGIPYENTSTVTFAITTPTVGTTGGHIVLRALWSAQTVRLVAVRNTDGVNSTPALTQVAGTLYEIRLASFTITTGGVITVTDTRGYAHFSTMIAASQIDSGVIDNTVVGNRVATFTNRQGGDATNWANQGTTNYTPTLVKMQGGSINISISGTAGVASITFPVAFSATPLVIVTNASGNSSIVWSATSITASGFVIQCASFTGSLTATLAGNWIAIGPA